ncbi:tetratricopeptide repeat protein [Variovorax sp. J2P1-59]|uniref:tetratricopeptide repeat protein n=1 Tax=Variovorax flavidus TaxID=3053501 RepID=UPI00257667D9|nr:tetratricopeptide repeat protein [Variovorax sp. J2P1-59]MDM0073661.1 tetratricopeptide repeat protein [Variovorax sp. J2P1-59]
MQPDPMHRQQIAAAENYFRAGQTGRAEEVLRQIAASGTTVPKVFELLAYICGNRGQLEECEANLVRAAALPGCSPEAFFYLGKAQLQRGKPGSAVESLERSIALAGEFFEALHELGVAHAQLDEHERALQAFQRAEIKNRRSPVLLSNMGHSLSALQRHDEALRHYERVLALDPQQVETWTDRGDALAELGREPEALDSYDRALKLDPDHAPAWLHRANTLLSLRRHAEALESYEKASRLAPDTDYLRGYLLHLRMHVCRWDGWAGQVNDLLARVTAGERASTPFTLMAAPAPPAALLQCARTFAEDHYPARGDAVFSRPDGHRKIRVAYFSADFRNHATSQLMVRLFECQDRNRFEWFAFSLTRSRDDMSERVAGAFDHFVDVSSRSDADVAAMARAEGIDIAVDLHGFTQGYRPNIFAHRAAPIQVNFLGFPGSMGCDYIDYILADATLIHPDEYGHYAEKVVTLPGSYQPNDNTKAISPSAPTRESLNLPAGAFVFACFNNNYKITPDVFDVWMRLLLAVPGSVLWLLKCNDHARTALEAEARQRGVDPARIVWAEHSALPDHLARHAHADLFLDTFHYGAHTTCSDALWSGLPVLTLEGPTFASRVSASLLRAAGLPELVTGSVEQYEAAAKSLAESPQRLAGLRARLQAQRAEMPLFDSPRFARGIEAAFEAMWERWRNGLPPDHISIPEVAASAVD